MNELGLNNRKLAKKKKEYSWSRKQVLLFVDKLKVRCMESDDKCKQKKKTSGVNAIKCTNQRLKWPNSIAYIASANTIFIMTNFFKQQRVCIHLSLTLNLENL